MKIAAFNVKQLGWKKVNNPFVRENLIKIVSRYSVVVMLEVIDATGKAMDKFLVALNNHKDNVQHPYEMKCSEPLGRSSYKEKFVFFYRKDQVKMINSYQYEEEDDDEYEDEEEDDDEYEDEEDDNYEDDTEDEAVDVLAREPFILQFKSPTTAVKKLALIPVHTKPEDAKRELDAVDDVVKAVRKRWRTTNIMILGDFNADGHYVSEERLRGSRIASPPYHWLIGDDADTTTSNRNDYTYDRIVVYRKTMLDAVVPGSAKPFNFQKEFNLTDEQTLSISDHYPVEVELRTNQKAPAQGPMALPRTTKTTSIKRQTQKKGAQKKRRAKPAEKITKAELAGAEKKKTTPAALQKKKKSESAGAQKKMKAKPAGAEKRKKIEAAGADKKKKTEAAGAEKKTKAKPEGAEKKKKTEAAGAEKKKKKAKAKPAGAEKKKKKTEAAGAEKKKAKAKPAGAEKKKKKTEAARAEKKKKKKAEAAGAEKKKTEAARAEKKKAEAAALQKTKNMTGKRTRGPSSDTPAKRRRLEKCQSNRLSTSCLTQ
ncbi:hypothetical protein ABVT39_022861 [Epinephelus coioides]